nr:LuxR C-terminal-related transcriptional regulator [uncultured Rhodococcus sp.]
MVLVDHRPQVRTRVALPGTVRTALDASPSVTRPTLGPGRVHSQRPAPVYASPGLTEREVVVLKVWLGCDSKVEVGARLHIALGTVNTHLTRIRDKYSRVGRAAPTKAALVARALQDGIVKLDDL